MNHFKKINEGATMAENQAPREGGLTRTIELQTAKIPSVGYLSLAIGSIGLSVGLEIFLKKKEIGNFVGLWAPTFLLIGIYNKLVKMEYEDLGEGKNQKAA